MISSVPVCDQAGPSVQKDVDMISSVPDIGATSSTVPEAKGNFAGSEDPCLDETTLSFNRQRHGKYVCEDATTQWVEWVETGFTELPENLNATVDAVEEGRSKQRLVCRILREKLRRVNPYAYTPMFFSFGPFHAVYERCQQTQHKMVIARSWGWQTFKDLRAKIEENEKSMRDFYQWYDSLIRNPSTREFSTQLALDAIMIASRLSNENVLNDGYYSSKFFDDVILFENQIPLSAIALAYECKRKATPSKATDDVLTELHALWKGNCSKILFDFRRDWTQIHNTDSVHYSCVLSLLYELFAMCITCCTNAADGQVSRDFLTEVKDPPPHSPQIASFSSQLRELESLSHSAPLLREQLRVPAMEYVAHVPIPTATKLRERTGIIFECTEAYPRVRFDAEKRTLYLPKIYVGTSTERVLRNVLTYEAESRVVSPEKMVVTGYVLLMDDLIDKDADVELLVESGVIHNLMGSHEAVANLWNSLCTEVPRCSTKDLVNEATKVSKYYKMKVNRWKALFYEIYWQRKPWLLISIVSALFLLVLSFLQTLYTMWGFYKIYKH